MLEEKSSHKNRLEARPPPVIFLGEIAPPRLKSARRRRQFSNAETEICTGRTLPPGVIRGLTTLLDHPGERRVAVVNNALCIDQA